LIFYNALKYSSLPAVYFKFHYRKNKSAPEEKQRKIAGNIKEEKPNAFEVPFAGVFTNTYLRP